MEGEAHHMPPARADDWNERRESQKTSSAERTTKTVPVPAAQKPRALGAHASARAVSQIQSSPNTRYAPAIRTGVDQDGTSEADGAVGPVGGPFDIGTLGAGMMAHPTGGASGAGGVGRPSARVAVADRVRSRP